MMSVVGVIVEDERSRDIMEAALKVLEAVSRKYSLTVDYKDLWIGETSVEKYGIPLSEGTVFSAGQCDHILACRSAKGGLDALALINKLDLSYNLRWMYSFESMNLISRLGDFFGKTSLDVYIVSNVRSVSDTEDNPIYVDNGIVRAHDNIEWSELEIDSIVRLAFDLALKRKGKISCVDRSNLLHTSKLWRMVIESIIPDYPKVAYKDMLIEDFLVESFNNLKDMDVILADSYLADIIATCVATIAGAMSLANAYINKEGKGIYGIYNPFGNDQSPLGMILSVSMMLKFSFCNREAANAVVAAIEKVLNDGCMPKNNFIKKETQVSAIEFGTAIAEEISKK